MKYVTGMGCVWDSPEHNEIEALRRRVVELQRQLAEVTAQRDGFKRQLGYAEGCAPAPAGAPNGTLTFTGETK